MGNLPNPLYTMGSPPRDGERYMRIEIDKEIIAEAKELNRVFQEQKSSDKNVAGRRLRNQKRQDAWIGFLMELVYGKYLKKLGVSYVHVPMVKRDSSQPDFIVEGLTIDVKGTRSGAGMFMQPTYYGKDNLKWDLYVGFRTSWSGLGKVEERKLEKIFAAGKKPFVEIIGFSTKGFMKHILAGNPVPDVWADTGRKMWNGSGLEKNVPFDAASENTKVFPPSLLFQEPLLRKALTRTDVVGKERFSVLFCES